MAVRRDWLIERPASSMYQLREYKDILIDVKAIEQYYLNNNVKIRKVGSNSHQLVIKTPERIIEVDILGKDYDRLAKQAPNRIDKIRYSFRDRLTMDVFMDPDQYILKAEFNSTTEAENYSLPKIFEALVIHEIV